MSLVGQGRVKNVGRRRRSADAALTGHAPGTLAGGWTRWAFGDCVDSRDPGLPDNNAKELVNYGLAGKNTQLHHQTRIAEGRNKSTLNGARGRVPTGKDHCSGRDASYTEK
jgi:hypothetical protein